MGKLQEVNPDDYRDYCAKRKLSRPFHRKGDTAVMGWREALELPYWIHKAMCKGGYKNQWSWVFEPGKTPNENTSKFKQLFPEFAVITNDDIKEMKRQSANALNPVIMQLRNATEPNYAMAEKYLNDRIKNIKQGVAI